MLVARELQIRRLTYSLRSGRTCGKRNDHQGIYGKCRGRTVVNCISQTLNDDRRRPPGHWALYHGHACLGDPTRVWQARCALFARGKANVWPHDYAVRRPLMYGLTMTEQFPGIGMILGISRSSGPDPHVISSGLSTCLSSCLFISVQPT